MATRAKTFLSIALLLLLALAFSLPWLPTESQFDFGVGDSNKTTGFSLFAGSGMLIVVALLLSILLNFLRKILRRIALLMNAVIALFLCIFLIKMQFQVTQVIAELFKNASILPGVELPEGYSAGFYFALVLSFLLLALNLHLLFSKQAKDEQRLKSTNNKYQRAVQTEASLDNLSDSITQWDALSAGVDPTGDPKPH